VGGVGGVGCPVNLPNPSMVLLLPLQLPSDTISTTHNTEPPAGGSPCRVIDTHDTHAVQHVQDTSYARYSHNMWRDATLCDAVRCCAVHICHISHAVHMVCTGNAGQPSQVDATLQRQPTSEGGPSTFRSNLCDWVRPRFGAVHTLRTASNKRAQRLGRPSYTQVVVLWP
jgi:hypothetical protein